MAPWFVVFATVSIADGVPTSVARDRALYCTEAGPIRFSGLQSPRPQAIYRIVVPGKNIPGSMSLEWREGHLAGTWSDADGSGPILIVFHEQLARLTALYASSDPTGWEDLWSGTLAASDSCE